MIDWQRDVERFMLRHGLAYDAATHMLDLVSEVGELAKLVLQAGDYGRQALSQDVDFSAELGDALYSLLAVSSVLDVDARAALKGALEKYEGRIQEGGGPGSR